MKQKFLDRISSYVETLEDILQAKLEVNIVQSKKKWKLFFESSNFHTNISYMPGNCTVGILSDYFVSKSITNIDLDQSLLFLDNIVNIVNAFTKLNSYTNVPICTLITANTRNSIPTMFFLQRLGFREVLGGNPKVRSGTNVLLARHI